MASAAYWKVWDIKCFTDLSTDKVRYALIQTDTIAEGTHPVKLSTPREQDMNLCNTWVQTPLNEVEQKWKPLLHGAITE